jgi:hypothetical protein
MTPPPATISGRCDSLSIRNTFSACARVADGRCTVAGSYVSRSNSISACCTSIGRSMSTGPGRPERISANAFWKTPGTCPGSSTVTAHFVTGAAIAAMSTAWKSSLCNLATGA